MRRGSFNRPFDTDNRQGTSTFALLFGEVKRVVPVLYYAEKSPLLVNSGPWGLYHAIGYVRFSSGFSKRLANYRRLLGYRVKEWYCPWQDARDTRGIVKNKSRDL